MIAQHAVDARRPWTWSRWLFSPSKPHILIVLLALVLYIPTLPPTVLWGGGDFARYQDWAHSLHLEGGALGHPLWVLLAHLFTWLPIGDAAYRTSLASAVISALALPLVFAAIFRLTASIPGAWLGAVALAVSHVYWTYTVMPKGYSLISLLLALAIFLAIFWEDTHRGPLLIGLAVVFSLGAYTHLIFFLLAPAFLLYVALCTQRRDFPWIVSAAIIYALGALPALTLGQGGESQAAGGSTGLSTIHQFLLSLHMIHAILLTIGIGVALLLYQYVVTMVAVGVGALRLFKQRWKVGVLFVSIIVLNIAFVFSWLPSQTGLAEYAQDWQYYLPMYIVLGIVAGVGFPVLWARFARSRFHAGIIGLVIGLPILTYAVAPVAAKGALNRVGIRSLPGRDNATYLLSPWKQNEFGARTYGEAVFRGLPPHPIFMADYSIYWVMRYLQDVEHLRPDVTLVEFPPTLAPQMAIVTGEAGQRRPLFIADTNRYYAISVFEQRYIIQTYGLVYRLVPRTR